MADDKETGVNLEGKNVFLSGPITDNDSYMDDFAKAKEACEKAGASFVFNPATAWGHSDKPSEWYMIRDVHRLTECVGGKPLFDALVQLDGWSLSRGAMAEFHIALVCGIQCVPIEEVG